MWTESGIEYLVRFASAVDLYELGSPGFDIDHRVVQFVLWAYKAFVKFHRGRLVLEVFSKLESPQISSISPEFPLLCRHLDL
jgi:hypothetical protein